MTMAIRPMGTLPLPSSPAASRAAAGDRNFAGLLETPAVHEDGRADEALGFNALGMFGRNHATTMPGDDVAPAPTTAMVLGAVAEPRAAEKAPMGSTAAFRSTDAGAQRSPSFPSDAGGTGIESRVRPSLAPHTEQGVVQPFALTEAGDGGTGPSAAASRSGPSCAVAPRPPMDARVTVHVDGQSAHVVVRAGALSEAEAKRLRDRIEDLLARGDLHLASLTLDGAFDGNTTRIMGERHGHFQR